MKSTTEWKKELQGDGYNQRLADIYIDERQISYQKDRYTKAIERFEAQYGEGPVVIYSAPGRSEVGGNHTDHQHGEILAASINLDAIAVTRPLAQDVVRVVSDGYDEIVIDIKQLGLIEEEKETTAALVKGVLAGVKKRGYQIGGFESYITSDVLIGAGLSSSAAFETVIGTILSCLYNDGSISSTEIAMIGQYAENVYFGKPCGLMDQMACATGSLVHVDFLNPEEPKVERIAFDLNQYGYSLCITDTKGSHADLTADYAAVPEEMKRVAAFFGKEVLRTVSEEDIIKNLPKLRIETGDRSVLRALHFINENKRVGQEVEALKREDISTFLKLVEASGNSSFKYLQNVYSNSDVQQQNVSLALQLSEMTLKDDGVCRVHGGGFAGTIQAFVKNEAVATYCDVMNRIFGDGACSILKIRKYGGIEV